LFSSAHQIILFPTPVVTFCTLIVLEGEKKEKKKKRTKQARSKSYETFLKP
jgi:hypothetical protein